MRQLIRRAILLAAGTAVIAGLGLTAVPGAMAAGIYSRPSIAIVGGNPVIAAQTKGDGLWFYWQQYGTRTWHAEQVAGNGTTYSDPAVTQVGDSTVIVAEGPLNTLDYYWQTIGTKQWHAEVVAGWFTTYSAPTVVSNGDSSQVVAEGPNHSLKFYWQLIGGITWYPETVAGAGTTYSMPQIAANEGEAQVVGLLARLFRLVQKVTAELADIDEHGAALGHRLTPEVSGGELAPKEHRAAVQERRAQRAEPAGGVVERQGHIDAVGLLGPRRPGEAAHVELGADMGDPRGLGHAGGAGGEDQERRVAGADVLTHDLVRRQLAAALQRLDQVPLVAVGRA